MTEWVIALGATTIILLVAFVATAKRCIAMFDEIQKMRQYTEDLKHSVRLLNTENEKLRSRVYVTEDSQRITALKLNLHLKQERIDYLQAQLEKQKVLLRQKWEASKK